MSQSNSRIEGDKELTIVQLRAEIESLKRSQQEYALIEEQMRRL